MNMKLNDLAKQAVETARSKGFWQGPEAANFPGKIALMHSELSEALEEFRNGKGFNEIYFSKDKDGNDKPEGIPVELADCIIRILDACGGLGIDLDKAMEIKMAYNKTRPHMHGKKI